MKCAICLERRYRIHSERPYSREAFSGSPEPSDAITVASGAAVCLEHHDLMLEAADSHNELIGQMVGRTIRFEIEGDDD